MSDRPCSSRLPKCAKKGNRASKIPGTENRDAILIAVERSDHGRGGQGGLRGLWPPFLRATQVVR